MKVIMIMLLFAIASIASFAVGYSIAIDEHMSNWQRKRTPDLIRCRECRYYKRGTFCPGGHCGRWGVKLDVFEGDFCSYAARKSSS